MQCPQINVAQAAQLLDGAPEVASSPQDDKCNVSENSLEVSGSSKQNRSASLYHLRVPQVFEFDALDDALQSSFGGKAVRSQSVDISLPLAPGDSYNVLFGAASTDDLLGSCADGDFITLSRGDVRLSLPSQK